MRHPFCVGGCYIENCIFANVDAHDYSCTGRSEVEHVMSLFKRCEFKKGKVCNLTA